MAVIGNSSTQQAFTPAIDYFSGNGSTTAFTLSRPVASVAQVQVTIDNVAQNPSSAYTVSSNTITFTSAPLSGTNNIYVYYTSPITQVIAPGQGTVTTTSMASSTGTGAGVFQTSPTINTPTLASANITTALTLTGASGTSGQALTSGGSGVAPTWTTIGASTATPTSLGTVLGNTLSTGLLTTALGYQATNSTTGSYNVAVGYQTQYSGTSATQNVSAGYQTLYSNVTGNNNVAIGHLALRNNTGSSNTAVGYNALNANTSNNSNVAVGSNAGQSVNGGYENVFVGAGAGLLNTTGYFNICIGRSAGENTGPTTGSSNTLIGNDARVTSASANTQLVVAARQTAVAKGDNTGFIDGGTGGIYQGNNSSSWSTTSDRRLKKNIVDNTEGLNIVSQIRVRNFEYKTVEEVTELAELPAFTTIEKTGVQLGVIAQELEEVCADCVTTVSTGVKTVDSDNIFWHMVNAIKDLKALNDTQAATITALTARITALENK